MEVALPFRAWTTYCCLALLPLSIERAIVNPRQSCLERFAARPGFGPVFGHMCCGGGSASCCGSEESVAEVGQPCRRRILDRVQNDIALGRAEAEVAFGVGEAYSRDALCSLVRFRVPSATTR